MFKAQTEDKESLQALAFSLRQNKGSDITFDEIKNAKIIIMHNFLCQRLLVLMKLN